MSNQRKPEYAFVRRRVKSIAPQTHCMNCGAKTKGTELCGQCLYDEHCERMGWDNSYDDREPQDY